MRVQGIYTFVPKQKELALPLFLFAIQAGFPSPADDYIDQKLDLNEYLVKNPPATYFIRVSGNSMIGAGIHSDDILIVDRSIEAADGKIVIAVLDGDMTVKRIRFRGTTVLLVSDNPNFQPIEIEKDRDFQVWGVVTRVLHSV